MQIIYLVAGGRAGSDFFQGFLDGHSQILQFPGIINQGIFDIFETKNAEKIVKKFIQYHPEFFNSKPSIIERKDRLGRNKNKIPVEVLAAIINGTEELLSDLEQYGVSIHSTGGETADVGDLVKTIIVDSTVTARMKKEDVIDNARKKAGDVIVGMESFGQASYEKQYNGGMGSNGLTSARHDVFGSSVRKNFLKLLTMNYQMNWFILDLRSSLTQQIPHSMWDNWCCRLPELMHL